MKLMGIPKKMAHTKNAARKKKGGIQKYNNNKEPKEDHTRIHTNYISICVRRELVLFNLELGRLCFFVGVVLFWPSINESE